jgi:hypothetical protein
MEVLGASSAVFTESLTSNMALTDAVHVPERTESLTSNMSLTSNGVGAIHLTESLTSTLAFTQVLSRTQEASLTSTMAMASESGEFLGVGESAVLESEISFSQEVVTSGLLQIVDSVMSLSQDVVVKAPEYLYPASVINFNSVVGAPAFEKNESLEDTLVFSSYAGKGIEESLTSTITFTDEAYRSATPTSTISFVQTTDHGKTRGPDVTAIDFDQTVLLTGTWTRSFDQDLGIGHSLTYYVFSECSKKAYTPYIGESTISDNPTPPDADEPFVQGLPEGERFQLLYPGLGEATDTVELRAPNLDNRERLAFTRINRETRGGRLVVFADPTWPQVHTLVLSFTGLKKTEVDALQDFLKNHLGKEVGLIDWEGRQWVGIITTPSDSAVQDSGGSCGRSWTASLEFEGVLLDDMPSGSALNLTDSVVAVLA